MVWAEGHELQSGKYIVRDVLAQGGFGITYKVWHVRLNAFMVIKTPNEYLRHEPDYSKYVDRFINEGQMMERFSQRHHPHIVRVRDLFEEGDTPCMVMDFVEGENLFQWVRRQGVLPEAEILPCIRQIGGALASIHQERMVHRDAHPGNIMRCEDGSAVLIDFGIAKELVPTTQSSTGLAGNRGFAPYEQMFQGSREVTVDIYCLAASLYYAVTGQRPVEAIARKLSNTPLIAPRQYNRGLSDHVNQAILKGMALEAADRPRSMEAWLQLLEAPKEVRPPVQSPPPRNIPNFPPPGQSSPPHNIPNFPPPGQQTSPPPRRERSVMPTAEKSPTTLLNERLKVSQRKVPRKIKPIVPWELLGVLMGVLIVYGVLGFLIHFFYPPNGSSANTGMVMMAVLLSLLMAWFGAWTGTSGIVLTILGLLLLTWFNGGFWNAVLVVVATYVIAAIGNWIGEKLHEVFNRWQIFLVLLGFSVGGLGLGWWLRSLFPSGT
jgi:serine/threonine protein kinase